jgi:hypothetical protein
MASKRISFARIFDQLTRIARKAESPNTGWRTMRALAAAKVGPRVVKPIVGFDLDRESAGVRRKLQRVLDQEPPPRKVETLLFGLFDAYDLPHRVVVGFDEGDLAEIVPPARTSPSQRQRKARVRRRSAELT